MRIANGIKEIFDQSIFGEGYDLTMLFDHKQLPFSKKSLANRLNFDQRVLIVFGGFEGLDSIVDGDERSKVTSSQFQDLFSLRGQFDYSDYGVKTLRIEEEMFMILHTLKDYIC